MGIEPFDTDFARNLTKYRIYAMGDLNSSLVTISTGLSIAGCLIIISTYIAWKDIRTTSRKILVYISIADLLTAMGILIGLYIEPHARDYPCLIQSFLTGFSTISSCLWTTAMAIYLYMCLVLNNKLGAEKLMPYFHVICWGVGLLVNVIAISDDKLGNSADALTAGWCWIKVCDDYNKNTPNLIFWTIIDGKLWEFLCYVTIFVLYIKIKCFLKRGLMQTDAQGRPFKSDVLETARTADRKLVFIPVFLVFIRIWGTIRFILFMSGALSEEETKADLSTSEKILLSLQGIGDSAQGFINCLLFCAWTPKIRNRITESLASCVRLEDEPFGRSRKRSRLRKNILIADDPLTGDETTPLLYPQYTAHSTPKL